MTRRELISVLKKIGSDSPETESSLIVESLFGVSRTVQMAEPDRDYQSKELDSLIVRRKEREPLQYILGKAFFCNEEYLLNRHCLIPRQETEALVLEAARTLPRAGRFADLFCGSGCVGISLACMRKDCTGVGIDISAEALEVAEQNTSLNGCASRISFLQRDLSEDFGINELFDVVTANPPYITSEEMKVLQPEVRFEPRTALDGGKDGLDFYRAMLVHVKSILRPGGLVFCEIGCSQGKTAGAEAEKAGFSCTLIKDLSGRDRIVKLNRKED